MFLHRAGIEAVHVPHNGAAPSAIATAAGNVQFVFDTVGTAQALVADGKLRGLAVTGRHRMAAVADVPTLAEAGFDVALWVGLLAPYGVPALIIIAPNVEIQRFFAMPEA